MTHPVCEKCGNDGSKAALFVTIDARWDHERKAWILDARDDEGGRELDCLACDHRTDDPEFPYEFEVPVTPSTADILKRAESFISGFEGDELQEGIDELLRDIRAAIGNGEGQ